MAKLVKNAPTVVGSLTKLLVVDGSLGFSVGDTVAVTSSSGVQGTARVSSAITQSGLIEFTLLSGGWGYSANANVFISDVVLTLVNMQRPIAITGPQLLLNLDLTQGTMTLIA